MVNVSFHFTFEQDYKFYISVEHRLLVILVKKFISFQLKEHQKHHGFLQDFTQNKLMVHLIFNQLFQLLMQSTITLKVTTNVHMFEPIMKLQISE